MMIYIVNAVLCAAGAAGGLFYVNGYLEKREITLIKKERIYVFMAAAAILCAAYSVFVTFVLTAAGELPIETARYSAAVCGMAVCSISDIKSKLIPNMVCLVLGLIWAASVIFNVFVFGADIIDELILSAMGAALGGGLLLIGRLISRNGMGMGDIKLMLAVGALIKFDKVFGLIFWALVFALIFGVILMIMKKAKPSSTIFMAPFFFAGSFMSLLLLFISELQQ